MRRIAFLLFCGFMFSHCQKDVSREPPQSVLTDPLLNKEIYTWPAGQTSSDYLYNREGKLVSITYTDLGSGKISRVEFLRDNANRITRVNKTDNGQSSIRDITYMNNTVNKILFARWSNGAVRDSTVFNYDAAGMVITSDMFNNVRNDGSGTITPSLKLSAMRKYFYDASGNLNKISVFTDHDNNGNFTLNFSYEFDYDEQKNPLYFPDDAAVLMDDYWYKIASPNNVTMHVNNYGLQFPGAGDTLNYAFSYTQQGFPLVCNYAVGDTRVKIDFYY
jgi:hypothetical protein